MAWPERAHRLHDARQVHAVYEGEPVGWVVWLTGQNDKPVGARDIHEALTDLLDPGEGLWPDWFIAAANDLAARDTAAGRRYPCPCCEQPTLGEPPPCTHEICDECGSEDDHVQFRDLGYKGGANSESLREARENYSRSGTG